MDPVGPWSAYAAASYNRLATTTGVTGASDYHQLASIGVTPSGSHVVNPGSTTTTTHQLLLQAAHVSGGSVSSPSSFNPSRFLSPPPVGYDAVFSPLFHQKAHYGSGLNQRHQTLKHHGASGETGTAATADIVNSYGSMHHQTLAAAAGALFEHQASSASTSPYQPSVAHGQLHSPFGILPHESVLNGGGVTTQKVSATIPFENTFNAHGGTQTLNRSHEADVTALCGFSQENVIINASNKKSDKTLNSQLVKTAHVVSQSSPSDGKSIVNSVYHSAGGLQSQHQVLLPTAGSALKYACKCGLNSSNLQCCQSQQVIMGRDIITTTSSTVVNSNSVAISSFQNVNKSCLQSSNMLLNNSNKANLNVTSAAVDRRQTSSDLQQRELCSSGQSSPVCFTVTTMPSVHRPVANYNNSNTGTSLPARSSPRNVITATQYHSPHRVVVSPVQYCQNTPPVKSSPTDMIAPTIVSVTQKSPDCGVVPRMPSPLQAHLQSSPLGHAPSPVYPIYNSPVTSIHSPSLQQIPVSSLTASQCQQQQNYSIKQSLNAKESSGESVLPLDVTVQRRSTNDSLNRKGFCNTNSDCVIPSSSMALSWELASSDRDRLSNNNCQKASAVNSSYGTGLVARSDQQQIYFDCRVAGQTPENAKPSIGIEKKVSAVTCGAVSSNSSTLVNKQKKGLGKDCDASSDVIGLNFPLMGRIPPPAHNNSNNNSNLQQNDNFFDYDRWNFSAPMKVINGRPSLNSNCLEQDSKNNSSNFLNSVNQNNQSLNLPSTQLYPPSYSQLPTTLPQSSSFYNNLPSSSNNPGINVSLNSQCESRTNDLQNTYAELAAGTTEASVSSKLLSDKTVVDEQPKVIVPNIEEELDFLNDCTLPVPSSIISKQMSTTTAPEKKVSNSKTGGFMESYLKFLQGERDTSTPSLVRNNRRAPYTKIHAVTNPAISSSVTKKSAPSTNVISQSQSLTTSSYNPEDDPRYFPLPKTSAHRGSLDSSDDELDNGEFSYFKKTSCTTNVSPNGNKIGTANNEMKETSTIPVPSVSSDIKSDNKKETDKIVASNSSNKDSKMDDKKGSDKNNIADIDSNKSNKYVTVVDHKNKKSGSKSVKKPNRRRRRLSNGGLDANITDDIEDDADKNINEEISESVTPQRTVPKRKAKENVLTRSKGFIDDDDDDEDDIDNDEDEDFEPEWTPMDDDDDVYGSRGKRKKGNNRPLLRSYNTRRSADTSGSRRSKRRKSESADDNSPSSRSTQNNYNNSEKQNTAKRKDDKIENVKSVVVTKDATECSNTNNKLFNVGEFVAVEKDLGTDWPTIWRVDNKSLLQKYEAFEQNGETLYKSISTYSGFNPDLVYTSVPTRLRQQVRSEVIVELLRSEIFISPEEQQIIDLAMESSAKYQDNFEVYVQTLISQALDSNFLGEIIQEKDEYFLINMKAIDDITEEYRQRFIQLVGWQNRILENSLSTWPCYNILFKLKDAEYSSVCGLCDLEGAVNRVIMYGQPYNNENLEGRPPDPKVQDHKDMSVCNKCVSKVELYNKLVHQKYLMFMECTRRVSEKRSCGPEKDTTVILNELLADDIWLSYLFNKVRLTWAQVDRLEYSGILSGSEKSSET